jgi:hypothetical protein
LAVRPPWFIIGRTAKPSRRRRPVSSTLGLRKQPIAVLALQKIMKNETAKLTYAVAIATLLLLATNPELRALLLVLQSIGTEVVFLWLVVVFRSHLGWLIVGTKALRHPMSATATMVVHFIAAQLYLRPFAAIHNLLVPVLLALLSTQPATRADA